MKTSKIEQEMALKYRLGEIIKIDGTPNKNYFAPNTFIGTIFVSLGISAFCGACLGLLLLFILELLIYSLKS
ncbi:hypothetical protein WJM97_10620 [Okeanomitos corallinicola TIOX110]|uniref:Uncharacterized protein n=1 Tax=Okeanomitos corallinicola TIOX110 TaxID=3133117 RepID=A0ABZ2UYL0_9CYAN